MTIAITGATGHLGRLIIPRLLSKIDASTIIGLARSPAKGSDLGIAMREANYERPETLDSALYGIDTLVFISSSEFGKREAHHHNTIEAAKRNGVKRIVYTSILHADTSTIGLAAEHLATEGMIQASGIAFTLLRNGWYTENYAGSIPGAVAGGMLIGSAKSGRISSAARADFADAAVAVVTGGGHAGKTYELAGDESWRMDELAAELTRQTGKKIEYRDMPEVAYAEALAGYGMPRFLATAIAGWDARAAEDQLFDDGKQLSQLIGRPTTPMPVTVAELMKDGTNAHDAPSV